MAYGWKLGGEWGKIILTLFRLFAVVFGTYYLRHIIRQGYHKGFIICATLIYAGAIGNLIDSMFYGLIFENSGDIFNPYISTIFPKVGYADFYMGVLLICFIFPLLPMRIFRVGCRFGVEKILNSSDLFSILPMLPFLWEYYHPFISEAIF